MPGGEELGELKAQANSKGATMNLMYYGYASVSVRGPVTGQLYQFSRLQPVRAVDVRDAGPILKTRLFRRIR